jgi:hypothetical protein
MKNKPNYNRNTKEGPPFVKGDIREVVKRRKSLIRREKVGSDKDTIAAMTADLVQVLAENGIELKNVYSLAKALVKKGWQRTKKII